MDHLQYFGTIRTVAGKADALLCVDKDRPLEAMVHWFGQGIPNRAVLCDLVEHGDAIQATPRGLYYTNDRGGLYVPEKIADEELAEMKTTRASLQRHSNGDLQGEWRNGAGEGGEILFYRFPPTSNPPPLNPERCSSWDEFKTWSSGIRSKNEGSWFRGHGCNSFSLSTTFNRIGRTRLERYCEEELPVFAGHAEALLGSRLDLKNANDYAVVLGLARHHGLPTPIMDWTMSPYIAAFFAFSDVLDNVGTQTSTHVRIFALSGEFIAARSPPIVILPHIQPYFVGIAISLIHNPRLQAQQGRFLVTNVRDLEWHIRRAEVLAGKQILFAADVPRSCAVGALQDLSYMGLTAATMFPGLDGVGKMMRHQMSFKDYSSHAFPKVQE
jgi:FRG domain